MKSYTNLLDLYLLNEKCDDPKLEKRSSKVGNKNYINSTLNNRQKLASEASSLFDSKNDSNLLNNDVLIQIFLSKLENDRLFRNHQFKRLSCQITSESKLKALKTQECILNKLQRFTKSLETEVSLLNDQQGNRLLSLNIPLNKPPERIQLLPRKSFHDFSQFSRVNSYADNRLVYDTRDAFVMSSSSNYRDSNKLQLHRDSRNVHSMQNTQEGITAKYSHRSQSNGHRNGTTSDSYKSITPEYDSVSSTNLEIFTENESSLIDSTFDILNVANRDLSNFYDDFNFYQSKNTAQKVNNI